MNRGEEPGEGLSRVEPILRLHHEQLERKLIPGFTKKYNVSRLVFWQASESLESARAREKEIEGWRRSKKVELIEELNPYWSDLARLWTEDSEPP